ncbi:MAG: beta-phosphoglucomutase [Bacteroidota bacterium]|jgi:beta-phosphoglucomutase
MKIKGLLFDLDGVLVTTEHNHYIAWKRTADELGVPFSEKENELLKGISRIDSLKMILNMGNLEIDETTFSELLKSKNDFYLESIQSLTQADLLPGVLDLLKKATSMGIQLGVGSSSKNANFILNLLGISSYFDVVIDGNGVEYPKPHPEVFLNGAKALGLEPNECLVFEDAASGIEAAQKGGFTAIGVGNPTITAQADHYYNNLTEFRIEDYA